MARVLKKESVWRVIGAVLAGYATMALLSVVTIWIIDFFNAELRTAREMPTYYFVIVIVTDAIYSVAGGYLCAKIARTAFGNSTIGMIALGELIAGLSAYSVWYRVPHWYSLALLLMYPPLVWWG